MQSILFAVFIFLVVTILLFIRMIKSNKKSINLLALVGWLVFSILMTAITLVASLGHGSPPLMGFYGEELASFYGFVGTIVFFAILFSISRNHKK